MPLLQIPATCQASHSYTCATVYDWTSNATLAHTAAWLIGTPLAILALVVIGVVARWLLHRMVDRVVGRAASGILPNRFSRGTLGRRTGESNASARHAQRVRTMGSALKSMVSGVVLVVVAIMVVSELGYDVAPILAGAGIVGVALGFGSQTLVKDFLSGVFMIFEDQYGVDDVVDLGEAIGTVEAVSLRITRVRDINGTVWYVRNGEILRVGNMSQNWARTVLDVRVGYSADLNQVRRVLMEVSHDLWGDEDFKGQVIEEPEVWGVQSLDPDAVLVRVTMKTPPGQQWAVAREMRERIKARFDFEDIEIAKPQLVVWQRTHPADHAPQPKPAE